MLVVVEPTTGVLTVFLASSARPVSYPSESSLFVVSNPAALFVAHGRVTFRAGDARNTLLRRQSSRALVGQRMDSNCWHVIGEQMPTVWCLLSMLD